MKLIPRLYRALLDRDVGGKVLVPWKEARAHDETPSQRKKRRKREAKARGAQAA